jgi:hypothetical protein
VLSTRAQVRAAIPMVDSVWDPRVNMELVRKIVITLTKSIQLEFHIVPM